ncbi:unnamed protein product [Adineta steineri]|uniref:Flavin-containing monooxygenase n=1 Tax=Adineta steineri TaxID=433720 RepID=A0A813TZ26_9BILA|nr:unnamed protein product [Adineta steineri]CAF3741727.1 unnamed protein product [Adineta steineri]CAF3866904.1 unnamed protein product [Adineta steineri]
MSSSIRVAICGAGPSGLSQLHAFESARQKGCEIPEIICYEKQSDLGGQWNYTWRTGLDEYNEHVHSSMYFNLWTNLPKECAEYVDYSYDKHFGQSVPSYLPRNMFYDYIRGYAQQNNVCQYIQFNKSIQWINYLEEKNKFNVLVKDLKNDKIYSEEFDYVIIATGHYSTPFIPYLNGIETFPGRLLHSHDYRFAEDFQNKNVLIVGNGISGEDIALELYKYGTKFIRISYRTKAKELKWPDEIKEVLSITKIDKNIVYFKDDSSERFDAIIYCTGYVHHFPYLDDNLRLKSSSSIYLPNLYKTIFWLDQPRLIYIGMQRVTFALNIANIQSWYARDFILGNIKLPLTKQEMELDIKQWKIKEKNIKNIYDAFHFQKDYIIDLLNSTDYPNFNVEQMMEILFDCIKARNENILTYRDKIYTSPITNTIAKQHHTTWIKEFHYSLEDVIQK